MSQREKTSTTRLPRELLDRLNISSGYSGSGHGGKSGGKKIPGRKERRRNDRTEKKQTRQPSRSRPQHSQQQSRGRPQRDDDSDFDDDDDGDDTPEPPAKKQKELPKPVTKAPQVKEAPPPAPKEKTKSILKKPKPTKTEPERPAIRKAVKDQLDKEDAEIAALEKKLKIKGSKLPKSFEEDGLDFILDGLEQYKEPKAGKGLKRKRTKEPEPEPEDSEDSASGSDEEMDFEDDDEGSDFDFGDEDGSEEEEGSDEEDEDEEFSGFASDADSTVKEDEKESESKESDERELDIYGKPKNKSIPAAAGKYIPPSLRKAAAGEDEELVRLKRQIQGTLNRLSEANILKIISEIEQLYRNNSRNSVSTTVTDIILSTVCDRSTHLDTFMVLHAGFIAALYKIMGIDFGAHVVQTIVEMFDKYYKNDDDEGKQCTNIVSFLSELYNFQVIGSTLMFDFVRLFLEDITETNAELLLKIVRNCGPQLRADDPTALKDLVLMMQSSVAKVGEENLTVRTKFTIETITNLKNNKLKSAVANTVVLSEATNRMKKILGTLNMRQLRATEPLRASLGDIRDVEKKGKWWLVGASWRDNLVDQKNEPKSSSNDKSKPAEDTDSLDGGALDVLQLAREQRMNTDVRRAIFVTIMSGEDFQDACERLLKLRLKKNQEREIPRVLLHCCGGEQVYNPYYALIARRLCAQHTLKMTFQFCLWDFFRNLGEDDGGYEGGQAEEEDEDIPMRKIVNLAKFYGALIAEGALTLNVLKNLGLASLQARTRTFLEVLIIALLLKSQPRYKTGERNEKAIIEIFLKANENSSVTRGLLYFLKKYVKKTDIAGGEAEAELVKWGVRVASDTLKAAVAQEIAG